jgi:lipoate---protein ligase
MLLIDRRETDPFFNLAAEEYVLKSFSEEVFMLWTSDASVVVGKHQVAAAEANLPYTWKASIPVIRRISGGGTVYHDPGNLNFSIVAGGEKEKLVDYARYTRGVIRGLAGLSVDAALQGKSSLFTGGLKFSGNAAHVYKNRVLHHGTLLFNTDLQQLRKCIRPDHRHYHDRSVRSVDSRITNLIDHLPKGMDMTAFREHIIRQARQDFPGIRDYRFTRADREAISRLAGEKYAKHEWNFGYSPRYSLDKSMAINNSSVRVLLDSEKGRISNIRFMQHGQAVMEALAAILAGCLHHPGSIKDVLIKANFAGLTEPAIQDQFVEGLF